MRSIRSVHDAVLSTYLHYQATAERDSDSLRDETLFAGLRPNSDPGRPIAVRPAGHNRNLQAIFPNSTDEESASAYYEVDERLQPSEVDAEERTAEVYDLLQFKSHVTYDTASAIVTNPDKRRYRLPIVAGTKPIGRDIREVQSERALAHVGNIFYEVPRDQSEHHKHQLDFRRLRPVAAHRFAIHDFCTWRGLLVLAGARPERAGDGHVTAIPNSQREKTSHASGALWFGMVDDLRKLGKPVGVGGPWKDTLVTAGAASDLYLMTGFDRKSLTVSHDADASVEFRIEVDYSNRDVWDPFMMLTVVAGETQQLAFPDGYSTHWVRLVPSHDCRATAIFRYD